MHETIKDFKSNRPNSKQLANFVKNRLAVTGLIIIGVVFIIALFAPIIAPHDPMKINLPSRLTPPGVQYLFGTDNLGRCILSSIIYGARATLFVGIIIVLISALFGTILGVIAAYKGGIIDEIIMRCVDVLLAFPGMILALVIAGLLEPSHLSIILALSVVGWTVYTRLVRGVVLSVKEMDYIYAARSLGFSELQILKNHVLPNAMAPVIVMVSFNMAHIILAISTLKFLGIGVQPTSPEWGAMLNAGRTFIATSPHMTIFPGLAILVVVLAFNFVGDGLRDVFDTKLK